MSSGLSGPTMRIFILMEALSVTGPAKNFLEFCRTYPALANSPSLHISLAVFARTNGKSPQSTDNEFLRTASNLGIELHHIGENFRFDPLVIRRLRGLVERLNPDLVETHFAKSHTLLRLSGLWKHWPWIGFHHGDSRPRLRSRVYNWSGHKSLRTAERVVTVSEASKKLLVEDGIPSSRIFVLHNAVRSAPERPSPESAKELRAQISIAPDERVILAVGRLSYEKAYVDLVAAMKNLCDAQPQLPVRLIILGEGPERPRIEHAIAEAGLRNRVLLRGQVSNVQPYFEMADVVAISSLSEGSPNVLLEAMAAGIPVVATAVGGIPEIASAGVHALLVKPAEPRAMAESLASVLLNQSLAQGLALAARNLVAAKYTPEGRTQSLIDLYTQVYDRWQQKRQARSTDNLDVAD